MSESFNFAGVHHAGEYVGGVCDVCDVGVGVVYVGDDDVGVDVVDVSVLLFASSV